MNKLFGFAFGFALLLSFTNAQAQTDLWPKEIPLAKTGGKLVIYQPQPDALEGNTLTGRSAIAVQEKAKAELAFGALFFKARLLTDKATRMASLESLQILNAKVNGIDDQAKMASLTKEIEEEVLKWDLEISIDQLVSTIREDRHNAELYNNTPPKIYYRDKPTSLVILDGEPKIKKDKGLDADRVINSPNLIFKEGNQWNMYNGGVWYKSASVTSGWTPEKSLSKKLKSVNDQIKKQEKEANNNQEVKGNPEITDILVSTEPAEVVQTRGKPEFKRIDSTSLEFVTNSPNDIFKDASGQYFILIAGRWYKSSSLNGPWVFNESDKMPADFAKIPEGSEKDKVLVSISGTPEAEEAIIDAEIPQTAKVERSKASVKVEYDGSPKFEIAEGTQLELAINSNLTVFKEPRGNYFVLDNGVWFAGKTANGPWKVSDTRPAGLESISPKSPAYNAKFVHIYESSGDYVVVGYTGGYLGNYIQGDPTIVFGTGFYYHPWYGSIYYPRPCTWGFNFCYNPYTGWTMGFGFNIGFMYVGFNFGGGYGWGYGGGGWFGPPLYRPPYYPPYYGGGYYHRPYPYGGGNNIVINNNNNININNGNININNSHNNIYNNNKAGNIARPGISSRPVATATTRPGTNYKPGSRPATTKPGAGTIQRPVNKARPVTGQSPNNVFTDKEGNVFQKDQNGNINQRDKQTNTWKPAPGGNTNHPGSRDIQSRDRGNDRTTNFDRMNTPPQRPAPRPANPSMQKPAPRPSTRPAARPAPAKRPSPAARPMPRGGRRF